MGTLQISQFKVPAMDLPFMQAFNFSAQYLVAMDAYYLCSVKIIRLKVNLFVSVPQPLCRELFLR